MPHTVHMPVVFHHRINEDALGDIGFAAGSVHIADKMAIDSRQ